MRLLAAICCAAVVATGAQAYTANWQWLVAPQSDAAEAAPSQKRRAAPGRAEDADICVREILAAQQRYGIPDNLLLAIGLQETGQKRDGGEIVPWPWSANAAGEGRWFEDRTEAVNWVRHKLDHVTKSVDVGCMQINLRWHPDAFASMAEGFDAAANVDYAARLLVSLHDQVGNWRLAAGSYHSFTPEYRNRYLASLDRKISRANSRISQYREIARRAGAPAPQRKTQVAQTSQPARPAGGPMWSAAMTSEGRSQSLFGSDTIKPLLSQ